jgi:hypothetical protein
MDPSIVFRDSRIPFVKDIGLALCMECKKSPRIYRIDKAFRLSKNVRK